MGTRVSFQFAISEEDYWKIKAAADAAGYRSAGGYVAALVERTAAGLPFPPPPPPEEPSRLEMVSDAMGELERWLHDLQKDPDSVLRVGNTIVPHRFWSVGAILEMFDPDGRKRTSSGGVIRALKRGGFAPVGTFPTKDGVLPLWDLRPGPKVAEPGRAYDTERGCLRPELPAAKVRGPKRR